jgi:hypothetical protein
MAVIIVELTKPKGVMKKPAAEMSAGERWDMREGD